ncbi:class I SAM-dependent methyltransferase [Nitrosopumilus adriaticus]|uniref:class I SAM-dependent methyltransferase n=1 Tax=Nitrosopumilus adriaticus TaxID=1580092 RepID=UPI00352C7698
MYKEYPYPSPSTQTNQTNELLNLLRIFELENKTQFKNQKFLDAGSGSGHRITNVAQFYKNCNFVGIDISDTSLKIAKSLKTKNSIRNIQFKKFNLMKSTSTLGTFDLILCMGVLHHLSNPKQGLQNILDSLKKDGMLFLYLYGKLGGHKRMLNKKLISLLLHKEKTNYESGIKLVRDLGLNKFEYGWNLNFKNKQEEDSLIVDSLLHANEALYDFDDIVKLLKKSKLYGFSIFGISGGTQGFLFDSRIKKDEKLSIPQTNVSKYLKTKNSISYYESLSLKNKCRVLDLLYEPNGYTIIGFTKQGYDKIKNERLKQNFIKLI